MDVWEIFNPKYLMKYIYTKLKYEKLYSLKAP